MRERGAEGSARVREREVVSRWGVGEGVRMD